MYTWCSTSAKEGNNQSDAYFLYFLLRRFGNVKLNRFALLLYKS